MISMNPNNSGTSLLQQVQEKQTQLLERLASGRRVNSASDDAAAQQIIDRLTAQGEGNRQAIRNAYDGISLAQVAESGLDGINQDVTRIRELAIQAGNGILSGADRRAIQAEIGQLQQNISQTIEQTNFAGTPLLSGDGSLGFQVGANAGQQIQVNTRNVNDELNALLELDVTSDEGLEQALEATDNALEFVGGARAELGAVQNQFASTARNLSQADVNTAQARSRIQDLDFAQAATERATNDVLGQAALTVQAQANQQQSQVLNLLS